MTERHNTVTFKGQPLTLEGKPLETGQPVPDFNVLKTDLEPLTRQDLLGKTTILLSVPSLDTSVCSTETKRFNELAAKLENVQVVTVSMDLPFAQKRWCQAEAADNILPASDHRDASFGKNFGVLVRELRLLARAVWVIDPAGVVRYRQIVPEMTDEPDYDAAIGAAKKQA